MQVKYIGTNDKTDSVTGVGLSWKPGQIHEVSSEVAERLCIYTDTWKKVGKEDLNQPIGLQHIDGKPENPLKMPEQTEPTEPIGLRPDEKPVEEPLPVVDFHRMNKNSMIEWAREKLNVKIDKKLSETDVRHKVTDAFAQHNLDNDNETGRR